MTLDLGDIKLNGKPYRIDIDSYRIKDVVDFSPRASTPGGGVIHSDLMLYQPMLQTDWRHGFGFPWYEDALGYLRTDGNVDTRQSGIASLFTKATSSDTNAAAKRGGILHKNKFYTWGDQGIRRFNGTSWEDVSFLSPLVTGTVTAANASAAGSVSANVTVPDAGTDPALVVFVAVKTNIAVSSVTYDGIPLIKKDSIGTAPKVDMWYLLNPPVGASHSLVATLASSGIVSMVAVPLAYVSSSSPFGTVATGSGTATSSSVAVAGAVGSLTIDAVAVAAGTDVTVGAGQTALKEDTVTSEVTLASSTEPGAVANTMTWSWTGSVAWAGLGVTINPSTSSPVNTLFSNGEYLFAVPAKGRIRRSDNSNILRSQPDASTAKATYIAEAAPTTNYVTSSPLYVGYDSGSKHKSILMLFSDLANLPSGASISSMKLKLYCKNVTSSPPALTISRLLLQPWQPKKVTWNTEEGTTNWNTAGARGSGTDIGATPLYTGSPTAADRTFVTFDFDLTQAALLAATNYGFIIWDAGTTADQYYEFSGPLDTNADWRPQLEIVYTVAGEWEDAGVSVSAGNDETATDYGWLHMHAGKVYAGKRLTNYVHYSSASDLSTLEGATTDTDAIVVGVGSVPVKKAITYVSGLYFARQDGLWMLGEDNIARRMLDYGASVSENNFRSMAVHNGALVFPIRDTLYQWNGARVSDITPNRLNDTFPYITYGRFDNLVASDNFLYCTARTNESTYSEALLCFDGEGWHKVCDLITDGVGTISMLAYDPANVCLWYHLDGASQVTYKIPLQTNSNFPYADFPTTGTHSLISSRWDMGFRRVIKSSPSLLVEGSNLSATTYLQIYYSIDGEDWVDWGQMQSSGVKEFTLPGGLHTQEYYYIQIRVDFVTDTATQSPILEGLTLRFLMRPELALGWSFNLPIADNLVYGGYEDPRTAQDIFEELWVARDSKAPVVFEDLDGLSRYVYITAATGQATEHHVDSEQGGHRHVEKLLSINLIEAK